MNNDNVFKIRLWFQGYSYKSLHGGSLEITLTVPLIIDQIMVPMV